MNDDTDWSCQDNIMPKKIDLPARAPTKSLPMAVVETLLKKNGAPSADDWGEHFAESIHFRLASRPVIRGAALARAELRQLFAPIVALGVDFCYAWNSPDDSTALVELDFALAGRKDPIPMVFAIRVLMPAPVIHDLRFYFDPAPLNLSPVGLAQRLH